LDFQNRASKKKGTKDGNVMYRIIIKLAERKYFLRAAHGRHASVERLQRPGGEADETVRRVATGASAC
jgi:hypothetical protein